MVPEIIGLLAQGLVTILGSRLVGLYLGGSASMGDFVAESSDYDFLVVTDGYLTPKDLGSIESFHQQLLRDHPEADRLEGDYAPRHLLVAQGTSAPVPGTLQGRFVAAPTQIILGADSIANMQLQGILVYGAPATEVLPAVTPEDVRAAVLSMLRDGPDVCRGEAEAASEVLNLVRSLCALETGRPTTKSEGVHWALTHLPERWHPLVHRAQAIRHGQKVHETDWTLRTALPELARDVRSFYSSWDVTPP